MSWRGYDRAQVDAFLRQTAADRQRLQEDLAQLDALGALRRDVQQRELARLLALRADIVSSFDARLATLQAGQQPSPTPGPAPADAPAANGSSWFERLRAFALRWPALRWPGLAWTGRRPVVMGLSSSVVLVLLSVWVSSFEPQASRSPLPVEPIASDASALPGPSAPASQSAVEQATTPVSDAIDGLLLTLTAQDVCWIRTTVDGEQPLERLLHPNETILLRAKDEAVLRIGDAAALSLLINNQPAEPLGRAGQVVTRRITRSNFLDFLAAS